VATTALLHPAPSEWNPEDPHGRIEPVDHFAGHSGGGFEIGPILAAIRLRLWLILAICAAAVAAAVLLTSLATPRYTANSSVQINDQSDRVISDKEDMTSAAMGWDTERFLKTQLDVLRSRGLAIRVAQKLKLFGNPGFYHGMGVEPPAGGADARSVRELTIGLLRNNMDVNLPADSRIATISFRSADPGLAAQIANAFSQEFIQSNLQRKFDSSTYARQFVAKQLADTRDRLEASERALNGYARQAGLIRTRDAMSSDSKDGGSSAGGGSVTTTSLLQLNEAANTARAQRIAAQGRWSAVNSVPLLSSKEVLGDSTMQALLTQRATLETKLQETRTSHLDDYPGIAEIKAQLASVNRQLEATANNVRAGIRADYTAAASSESALAAEVNSLKGATLAEQDRSVQYNLLAREADTNRTIYDGLLQRYKELNATAGVSSSNIAIIDQAEPPLSPSSPNLLRNIGLGLLVGVGLSALFVFLAIQLDDTVRVPEDIERKLNLPLLGVIPRLNGDIETALADRKSAVSEAYNALRGSLLHATSQGLPPVLLVTSAQPSEGKTTVSRSIAASLARLGRRVLLVDADMRRPTLHREIGNPNQHGLSSVLTSQDSLESAIIPSIEPGLSLLTSGPIPPSPTELTSSMRFRALIDEMAEKFDVVVLDSPPILGLADVPAMSALADGVIVIVESGRGRRGNLKAALRRLRAMQPVLLGAVLNKFDTTRAANKYSEYYGSSYYDYRSADQAA
jgi:succinoglycan biosynthesis transport protein ExoP